MRTNPRTGAALLCALALCGAALAQGEPPRTRGRDVDPAALRGQGEVRKLGKDLYAVGAVTVDAARREIRCPGRVNMREGQLELLACTPRGKRHESLLVLDVRPLHLHLALLLLEAEPGRNPGVDYAEDSPIRKLKPGDQVTIRVGWDEKVQGQEALRRRTVRAEELLWNVQAKRPMKPTTWVFQGSRMVEDRVRLPGPEGAEPKWGSVLLYGADVEGSLVTTYHDPIGILENPLKTVNADTWYEPHKKLVPAEGTPVEMIIGVPKKVKKTGAEKAQPEKPKETHK
jgi:hypothetical protein